MLKSKKNTVYAQLSHSQYDEIKKVLSWYFYESSIKVHSESYSGYPIGGEYIFSIVDTKENILRLMDLIDLNSPSNLNSRCFTYPVREVLKENRMSYNLNSFLSRQNKKSNKA